MTCDDPEISQGHAECPKVRNGTTNRRAFFVARSRGLHRLAKQQHVAESNLGDGQLPLIAAGLGDCHGFGRMEARALGHRDRRSPGRENPAPARAHEPVLRSTEPNRFVQVGVRHDMLALEPRERASTAKRLDARRAAPLVAASAASSQ